LAQGSSYIFKKWKLSSPSHGRSPVGALPVAMTIQGTDYLIGCSKLQDLLETIIEHINAHDADIELLKEDHRQAVSRLDVLDPDGAAGAPEGQKPIKIADLSDRLRDLEAKHLDLAEKVGVEHLELENEHAQLVKLEECEHRLEEQFAKLAEEVTAEAKHMHDMEEEIHQMEDHFKQVDTTVEADEKVQKTMGNLVKDLTSDVEEIKAKLGMKDAAGGQSELSDELRDAISASVAPLGAAIDALDAKYEATMGVRLESHEHRLTEQEKLAQQTMQVTASAERALDQHLAAQAQAQAQSQQNGDQKEAAVQNAVAEAVSAAKNEMEESLQDARSSVAMVQGEMEELSGKVSVVVDSVSVLEDELRAKAAAKGGTMGGSGRGPMIADPRIPPGGSLGPGGVILDANGNPVLGEDGKPMIADHGEMLEADEVVGATLGKVREQLEGRVTALEARISNSPELTGDISTMDPQQLLAQQEAQQLKGDDVRELSDTLQQLEADLRSLDAVATQDMRPKLEKQAQEMQRLWQQLNDVFEQMQAGGGGQAAAAGSMLTTKGGPRCLVCYDPRAEIGKKRTIVGKDGHTYFQSPSPTSQQQTMRPDAYSPPAESGSMVTALMKPRMLGPGGMSSRKYMHMPEQLSASDGSMGSSMGGRPSSRSTSHLRGLSPAGLDGGGSRGPRAVSRGGGSRMAQSMARTQAGVNSPSVAGFYF